MIETLRTFERSTVASWQHPLLYGRECSGFFQKEFCCFMTTSSLICQSIQWIHQVLWTLICWNIHYTAQTLCQWMFTYLDLWKNICRGLEMCRQQWGNGGGAYLIKGHTKRLFLLGSICKFVCRWTKCVAKQGGTTSKFRTRTTSVHTLVKSLF